MPTYSGVWNLNEVYQAVAQGLWALPQSYYRGLFAGGNTASGNINVIQYVTIPTTGNAVDFGDLTNTSVGKGALGSSTRGVFFGTTSVNNIWYVTIATTGNVLVFGELSSNCDESAGCSSSTRGICYLGKQSLGAYNIIEYITIATTGNSTDFGDLTVGRSFFAACSSPTRGICAGGWNPADQVTKYNIIDYITIASTGNATDFGDLSFKVNQISGCSSSTRGLFGGGYTDTNAIINVMEYITIASTGNATDFGDLTTTRRINGACSSDIRGLFGGGVNSGGSRLGSIDYVTIASTGNATDFGSLLEATSQLCGTSNCHGGL